MKEESQLQEKRKKVLEGGQAKYHQKNQEQGKQFARIRIQQLVDQDSFVEDGLFANCTDPDLPADGVITGIAKIQGRPVAVLANDSTVKAGSWGARTVEKMIRIQEKAEMLQIPVFYLVDSAGARITDQVEMFPGRRGAGRIFRNQARLSGRLPQICLLFGPSAAGGAYIPAFCDVVIMVDGNASMYLGSPRMAQAVIGEKVSLEEMGGAQMHCSMSGCGDFLVKTEAEAIKLAQAYFSYMPQNSCEKKVPETGQKKSSEEVSLKDLIPESPSKTYDMKNVISALFDTGSFLEIKALYAPEIITGLARIQGRTVGVVANQPRVKGGVLFVESSDKAARFIQLCDAYQIPLLFVADVPGFMIGSKIEKEGMIRAGAKFIHAMSNASVPKITLIVRKAYGAGLYAMCGPAFDADAVLALPTAAIAVMGPEPAINAVYFNKMETMEPEAKKQFIKEKISEYEANVNIYRMASELVVDAIIDFSEAKSEIIKRFEFLETKPRYSLTHRPIFPM